MDMTETGRIALVGVEEMGTGTDLLGVAEEDEDEDELEPSELTKEEEDFDTREDE